MNKVFTLYRQGYQKKHHPAVQLMFFILALVFIFAFFQLCGILAQYDVEPWVMTVLSFVFFSIPLVWMQLVKANRICLVLTTLILLSGDIAPALTSPSVALLTFSNFLYLLYENRQSKIRYFILPLIVISVMYAVTSGLFNVVDKPIMISYGRIVDLGWLGIFGGGLIVYHIIYLILLLYHVACKDQKFYGYYIFILSIFINIVVGVGLFQAAVDFMMPGSMVGRISSIFRLSTRLAPFIVVSLPLLIVGVSNAKRKRMRIYWWTSIGCAIMVLLLSQTRGGIAAGGVIVGFYLLGLISSRSIKTLLWVLSASLVMGIIYYWVGEGLSVEYFTRFDPELVNSGYSKRLVIWKAYHDGLDLQNTSMSRSMINYMFGYGWFSERGWVYPHNLDAHNTFISVFNTFGGVGFVLYYMPYVWALFISLNGCFRAEKIFMRPRYGMTAGLIVAFIASGFVHNKFYSPIESAYTWVLVGILLYQDLPKIFPQKHINERAYSIVPPKIIQLNKPKW